MPKIQEPLQEIENRDAFDSFYECITTCYSLEGEDAACVTRCVAVHLKDESSIEVSQ